MKKLWLVLFLAPALAFGWIHPDVKAAIEAPDSDDSVTIDGVQYPTGYHPSLDQYKDAHFKRVKVRTSGGIPKEFDLSKLSYSPVRRQVNGDCWAQGGVSAFEFTVNYIDKLKKLFSVQDVIDCSGFGTARRGGQLSMKHFERGAVLSADYPYTGQDQRCRTDVTRGEKAKRAFFLRGASGGMPTVQEVQTAILEHGALEICGSASALGNGGRQDVPRRGTVNHCYALPGWVDGKARGWKDAIYWPMKNSWGETWGDKGYGYYLLAPDGVHFEGNVIAELQGVEYKAMSPQEPVEFTIETANVSLRVVVQPDAGYSADEAKVALESVVNSL